MKKYQACFNGKTIRSNNKKYIAKRIAQVSAQMYIEFFINGEKVDTGLAAEIYKYWF